MMTAYSPAAVTGTTIPIKIISAIRIMGIIRDIQEHPKT